MSLPTRHNESTKIQASQRLKDILDEAVFLTKLAGLGDEQEKQAFAENPFRRAPHYKKGATGSIDYGKLRGAESKTETELSRTLGGGVVPQSFEEASNRYISVSMFEETPEMAEQSVSPREDDELGKLLRSNSSSSV